MARLSFGLDDGNGTGAKETLFIDANVVDSVAPVAPVPVVPRRPKMLRRNKIKGSQMSIFVLAWTFVRLG